MLDLREERPKRGTHWETLLPRSTGVGIGADEHGDTEHLFSQGQREWEL